MEWEEKIDGRVLRTRAEAIYNSSGELEEVIYGDKREPTRRYELTHRDGQVVAVREVRPQGWEADVEYSYDSKGRIDKQTHTGPESEWDKNSPTKVTTTIYRYDSEGRLDRVVAESPTRTDETTYKYDAQGRVVELDFRSSVDVLDGFIEYRYNDDGTLRRVLQSSGILGSADVDFEYREGRLDEVSSSYRRERLRYDDHGRVEEVRSDIKTTTITYGEGALQGLSMYPPTDFGYMFDATGQTFTQPQQALGFFNLMLSP